MTDQHTQASQNQQYRAQWLPGFGITADYGLCDTDATNVVHVSGSYALPVGRGKMLFNNSNRAVDAVLGGWAVNFIYSYQSGQPFTVNCPVTTAAGLGCFAPVVPGQNIYAGPHNHTQWLNPNAFSQPARPPRWGLTTPFSVEARSRRVDPVSTTWIPRSLSISTSRNRCACSSGRKPSTPPIRRNSGSRTESEFQQPGRLQLHYKHERQSPVAAVCVKAVLLETRGSRPEYSWPSAHPRR